MMNEKFAKAPSLCWDCAKATGGCIWSDSLKPVCGWQAIKYVKEFESKPDYDSYFVYKCPEFKRDAYRGGQVWKDPKKKPNKKPKGADNKKPEVSERIRQLNKLGDEMYTAPVWRKR